MDYEDEMDAAIIGALSACVGVLKILVDNGDNNDELNESIPRIPCSTRNEMRRKYVQSIIGVDDATSIKLIHINRMTFHQLCAVVRQRNLLHDTIYVTVHEQLLMFLHTISHNVRNGVMCVNYLRSGETVSRYFNHVLKALRQLHNDYIRPPDTSIPDEIRSREIYWSWFKGMSGVGWDDDAKMITMGEDTFNEYIAAHSKDGPYINKPIEMYEELVVICGDDQAIGSFSRTVADAVVDVDSISVNEVNDETSETPPPPRSIEDHSTSSEQVKRGKKRKRDFDSKIDLLANKIGDLASAISRSRNRDISMELYGEVMNCKGYDKSELVKAFDYLLANEIQARSFLARDDMLRQMWLEDFFGLGPS